MICFRRLAKRQTVLLTHGDSIGEVGANLKIGAFSDNKIVAAIYNTESKIYGVQFHPEVRFKIHSNRPKVI